MGSRVQVLLTGNLRGIVLHRLVARSYGVIFRVSPLGLVLATSMWNNTIYIQQSDASSQLWA